MASKEKVLAIFAKLGLSSKLQCFREEVLRAANESATSELERECIEEVRGLTEDWPTATMSLLLATYTTKLTATQCTKLLSLLETPDCPEIIALKTHLKRDMETFWSLTIDQIDFSTTAAMAQILPRNTYLQ